MNSLLTNQFLLLDLASPVFIQLTMPLIRYTFFGCVFCLLGMVFLLVCLF